MNSKLNDDVDRNMHDGNTIDFTDVVDVTVALMWTKLIVVKTKLN